MPRRDFITPSSLPSETQGRCISIPASQEWLGLINAALLMLTESWRYEQINETALTPEETAAAAYQIYVAYLESQCEDGMACCPMRRNPFTGRYQQSNDDGLTWFDVEDGPWTESLYPPFSSMPQPIDASDPECQAAANAAYVLRNLYEQTGNTLLNVVANTDWEYAGALGAMLQGFLMMIGAAAVQPFVALASLLGVVGVRQQYVDYPLDDEDEDRLKCIMLENATLQPSGAVTFDFQAVWDAIDLDSPKNGLVRFLLTMIGPDALNYAGAVDAGVVADCSDCYTCGEVSYDFTEGMSPWQVNSGTLPLVNPANAGYGTWNATEGHNAAGSLQTTSPGGGSITYRGAWYVDLEDTCMIDAVSFWQRRNSNFTSIDLRVSVYDASGVRVWNSARIGNDPGAWQQRIVNPGVSGQFVGIELQGQLGAGAGGMFIDDVVIGRS